MCIFFFYILDVFLIWSNLIENGYTASIEVMFIKILDCFSTVNFKDLALTYSSPRWAPTPEPEFLLSEFKI